MDHRQILLDELKGSVDFFLHFTNLQTNSPGFGLTVDLNKKPHMASIASTGYALTAWVIGAERGFISRERAREITRQTLETLLNHASHFHGFFAHYMDMETGERFKKCEYSTIDTAICVNGAITAAAYFHDSEISEKTHRLLERVDWPLFIFEENDRTLFRMAYNPDAQGDYVHDRPGFISQWDMAAEQKMMYLQAAGHIDAGVARKLYAGFRRDKRIFTGQEVIIHPGGGLYVYQCSEAWLDVGRYLDPHGVDWFRNTRLAALANRAFCLEHSDRFKTYHETSWGLSAGDSPHGYAVFGGSPSLRYPYHDGTVSIWGALACLPFIPEETIALVEYLFTSHPQTWGEYGFYDAYNVDVAPPWYSSALYGIDKGCSMIMIENYLSRLVWETYTDSSYIQKALKILGFTKRQGETNE